MKRGKKGQKIAVGQLEYGMYILYNNCISLGMANFFDIAEPLSTAVKQRPLGTDVHKHQKDWGL